MAHETLVKRTIWVAKCPGCSDRVESADQTPPKSHLCIKCNMWVDYVEQSYTGPDLKANTQHGPGFYKEAK